LEATWSDLLDGIANCYSKTAYGAISRLMTGNESKKGINFLKKSV
jgi:hypothetical protein